MPLQQFILRKALTFEGLFHKVFFFFFFHLDSLFFKKSRCLIACQISGCDVSHGVICSNLLGHTYAEYLIFLLLVSFTYYDNSKFSHMKKIFISVLNIVLVENEG